MEPERPVTVTGSLSHGRVQSDSEPSRISSQPAVVATRRRGATAQSAGRGAGGAAAAVLQVDTVTAAACKHDGPGVVPVHQPDSIANPECQTKRKVKWSDLLSALLRLFVQARGCRRRRILGPRIFSVPFNDLVTPPGSGRLRRAKIGNFSVGLGVRVRRAAAAAASEGARPLRSHPERPARGRGDKMHRAHCNQALSGRPGRPGG